MSAQVDRPCSGRRHDAICAYCAWVAGNPRQNNSGGLPTSTPRAYHHRLARASLPGPLVPHDQRGITDKMRTPSQERALREPHKALNLRVSWTASACDSSSRHTAMVCIKCCEILCRFNSVALLSSEPRSLVVSIAYRDCDRDRHRV